MTQFMPVIVLPIFYGGDVAEVKNGHIQVEGCVGGHRDQVRIVTLRAATQ